MSLIGTEVKPFTAEAYHNGKFITVTEQDFKGKWSIVVFYPADFTLFARPSLKTFRIIMKNLKHRSRSLFCFHRYPLYSQSMA